MQIFLKLAESIDRLSESIARIVRWGLLANALGITGNAVSRKLFSVAWRDNKFPRPARRWF